LGIEVSMANSKKKTESGQRWNAQNIIMAVIGIILILGMIISAVAKF
jgi:heme/copper-type cytochrome/quinol oxidase subunit 2